MRDGNQLLNSTARLSLVTIFILVASVLMVAPVGAQSSDGGSAGSASGDQRCLPDGGQNLTVGDGNPHIDMTLHTSLFTDPSPPSALGLAARGVAVDADIITLRTGVLLSETPDEVSTGGILDSLVVVFDYQFSLPMFAGSIDDTSYEPTDGPVSEVETRGCY